jgi:tetratricopeptide (TPR) repeat protein
MSEDHNSPVQQATDLVNSGNYEEALEQSRALLVTNPNNADAKLIEAISLSALGNHRDASEAFSAAIQMAPTKAKPRFNAAVHEFNVGNVGPARLLANEALNLDPKHEGVARLLERIGPEPKMAPGLTYPREFAADFEVPNEGIPFIKRLGSGWVLIGWILSLLSAFSFFYGLAGLLSHYSEISSAMQSADQSHIRTIAQSMQNPIMSGLGYILVGINLVWMIMDLIHRKGNFVWLLPHVPCSCVGFSFITMPIYILFGRK